MSMHKIYLVFILTVCVWILEVNCQRGGGKGGGGRGGGGGGGYRGSSSSSSCTTKECRERERIVLIVIFICFGGLLVFCLFYACVKEDEPSVKNATFVNFNPQPSRDECEESEIQMHNLINSKRSNIFRNGMWASRYYQHGAWNGPFEFLLAFDSQSMQLKGWGWDNVGKFTIVGAYSNESCRMGIIKSYEAGTGDSKHNLGHDVIIQLIENAQTGQFEGDWCVQTHKYQGKDKYEIKYLRECEHDEAV